MLSVGQWRFGYSYLIMQKSNIEVSSPSVAPQQLPMLQVLLCAGMVVTLSMGIRHGFGLWLQPITQDMGWSRESFSLAIAVQNIAWGVYACW